MSRKVTLFVEAGLSGLSLVALGVYLYVAFSRIAYPFTIEWIEANTFVSVVRVLEGRPIFVPPGYGFIPMIYPPLYYYVVATVARVSGQIMFSMRLVSVLASLQAFVMIYVLCRLRQITPRLSVIAVGLFVAAYGVTGYWFDVGRVDTLFLALLLTAYGLTMAHTKRDNALGALAGLVLTLSFATKQSALLAAPFLLLHLLLERRWQKARWFATSLMLSWGLAVVAMNALSRGWFWMYIYKIPGAHPISWQVITHDLWTSYLAPEVPFLIMTAVAATSVFLIRRNSEGALSYVGFVATFFLPLSIMSLSSMAKRWGYLNGLLPLVAALSVVGMEAYQRVTAAAATSQLGTRAMKGLYYAASGLLVFQFLALRYDFRAQIPTRATLEAGYRIVDLVRDSEGPVFIPTSPYLLHMAGQQPHFHISSLGDLTLAAQHDPEIRRAVEDHQESISEYLLSQSIKTVLLSNADWYRNVFGPQNGYECESLVAEHTPLKTLTGAISYLDRICRFHEESAE